jgi:DNA invertase Pin-like site-specific DNA recombinase
LRKNERGSIRLRQAEGIRIAKDKGIHLGRPQIQLSLAFKDIVEKQQRGDISTMQPVKLAGVSRSSYYKYTRALGLKKHSVEKIINHNQLLKLTGCICVDEPFMFGYPNGYSVRFT